MAWIETHRPDNEHSEFRDMLRDLSKHLPEEYLKAPSKRLPARVRRESIVGAHSLFPEAAKHLFAGHAALMGPDMPLGRRDQELISTVVSAVNDCFY